MYTTDASFLIHFQLVASTPTGVTVRRTGLTTAEVSWKSHTNFDCNYEVFYQVESGGNNVSVGNTSKTKLTLNGLMVRETYSIFVVAFSPEGTVLPSARSKIVNITTSKCIVKIMVLLNFYGTSYVITILLVNNRYSTTGCFNSHYRHKCIHYWVRDSSRVYS